jgi:hypothetical protein
MPPHIPHILTAMNLRWENAIAHPTQYALQAKPLPYLPEPPIKAFEIEGEADKTTIAAIARWILTRFWDDDGIEY